MIGLPYGELMKQWEQKELVQSLRHQGLSYREICSRVPFHLSRSTISHWCKEIELTPEQLDRLDQLYRVSSYRNRLLGPKATQRRRAEEVEAIKKKARSDVPQQLTAREFWVAGLMLYWAEGNKTDNVGFCNSDPKMVRFMMKWFRVFCHVPESKFRAYLHLHSGHDEGAIKAFWSQLTGVPLPQFGKSYIKREGTGHRKNRLYQGTNKIVISNRNLLHTIHGWIEGFCAHELGPLA